MVICKNNRYSTYRSVLKIEMEEFANCMVFKAIFTMIKQIYYTIYIDFKGSKNLWILRSLTCFFKIRLGHMLVFRKTKISCIFKKGIQLWIYTKDTWGPTHIYIRFHLMH